MDLKSKKIELFSHKNFFFLWSFQLLSLFGSELTRFALPIWLFQQEQNLISFSIFVSCGLLPRIFSPLVGGLIDRFNKKSILIFSGLSLVLISLSISAIISGFVHENFAIVCSLIFLIGIFSNFIHIATVSMVPQIVEKNRLLRAHSLMIAAESSSVLICPLLAGSLISSFGISFVILLDVFLFLISLIFLARIRFKKTQIVKRQLKTAFVDIMGNLMLGISFIKEDKKLISLLVMSGLINFVFSFSFVAFTPMILNASQNNTQLLGRISSFGSGAQLLTSIFAGYFLKSNSQISLMLKSILILGLCGPLIIGLKFSPIFWTLGYAMTLSLLSVINSSNNAFWQTCSPSALQGTIFGIRRMVSSAIAPIGTLLAGPLITLLFASSKPSFIESEYQLVFLFAGFLILLIGMVGASLKIFKKNRITAFSAR